MGDVLGLQPGSLTQQYRDYLIDLAPYAKATWGDGWEEKFYGIDAARCASAIPRATTGLHHPVESQIINILYNTKIFEKIGATRADHLAGADRRLRKLTDNGYAPLYFGGA